MLEDILLQVNKPGRYIGNEWNVLRKDFASGYIKFALCFPDLYEVGMSNLGIRIIYSILNNSKDVLCERFFSCAPDMEGILRENSFEILSLESKERLMNFDIIGFSLGSELNYTNVLNILELGNIPLRSCLRDHNYPLVIGGGPCCLNPEPMSEFFDLFIIGEAEELLVEFVNIYRQYKEKYRSAKISKEDLLFKFCEIPGVYVPSFYQAIYSPCGDLLEFRAKTQDAPLKIEKRVVQDFNSSPFPVDWLLPFIQLIHDRISLEIMRGCPNRCRFCQARAQYFPFRTREMKNILNLALSTYKRTGYEEITLSGLSVSDYAKLEELLRELSNFFKGTGVNISLPSLKAGRGLRELASLITNGKKSGLTFAPEAGSERLRKLLAKNFSEEDFFKTLEEAYLSGYRHVKLYFMLGLPDEELKDLDGIIDFSTRVSELRRRVKNVAARVNISVNALIPKPHTPFQWLPMQDLETIIDKQRYLRNKQRSGKLKLSFHNPYMSFLEGVLSRGDRRLSEVIFFAFKKGAKFDAWSNYFGFEKWIASFRELNIDPNFYLRQRNTDELMPWDFIDTGITKEELAAEFNKSIAII